MIRTLSGALLLSSRRALSDMGVLFVVLVLGVALFFLAPHFMSKKSGGRGQAPADSAKADAPAKASSSDAGLSNYTKAYQIGTSKAKAAQAAANDRNGAY